MTLRLRLAATAGVAVAFAALLLAVGVYAAARSELRGQIDRSLEARAMAWVGSLEHPRLGDRGDRGPPRLHGDRRPPPVPFGGPGGSAQLVARNGTVTHPPGETANIPVDPRTRAIAATGRGRSFTDATVKGVHLRVLTSGVGAKGALQVARPLTEIDSALRRILIVVAALGAAGIALAGVLGALVARTALAPVRRFTARTEAVIEDPHLSHRLEVRGRDELTRLARSFNGALDALERSLEAQRQLIADASHELRTPISSLRANIQIFEDAQRLPPEERAGLQADIVAELDELTALVADIAELARGSRPDPVDDDIRLDLITSALVERFTRRDRRGVRFEADMEETLVRADPERVSRAVSNLLDNAAKWSPEGGVVEVELRDGVLSVRDSGSGFAADDLPHVFDRFYRARAARATPGSGLGLAIVRQAAEGVGGFASAANDPDGGAILRVRFGPAPRPQPSSRTPDAAAAPVRHHGRER